MPKLPSALLDPYFHAPFALIRYGNRRVYEFEAYLEALLVRACLGPPGSPSIPSHPGAPTPSYPFLQVRAARAADAHDEDDDGDGDGDGTESTGGGLPSAVYVASDSLETPSFVAEACAADSPFLDRWPAAAPRPCLFSADADARFRTEHGSHTVAAGGGCHGNVCALQWYDILKYQQDGTYTELSKVRRWPAWKCVACVERPSRPGTPTPSRCSPRCAVAPLHIPFCPICPSPLPLGLSLTSPPR